MPAFSEYELIGSTKVLLRWYLAVIACCYALMAIPPHFYWNWPELLWLTFLPTGATLLVCGLVCFPRLTLVRALVARMSMLCGLPTLGSLVVIRSLLTTEFFRLSGFLILLFLAFITVGMLVLLGVLVASWKRKGIDYSVVALVALFGFLGSVGTGLAGLLAMTIATLRWD